MKTTLDIDDDLLARATALAARRRISLSRLVEDALRLAVQQQAKVGQPLVEPLPVLQGHGGLQPGVNGLRNRSLLDVADDEDSGRC